MLVEPTYKDYWEIPGGYIESGETPLQACTREISEELRLKRQPGGLFVVDWAPSSSEGDKILFVFDGGSLTTSDIDDIKLPETELASFDFLPVQQALKRLIPRLSRRVEAAVQARAEGRTFYLEHGVRVW